MLTSMLQAVGIGRGQIPRSHLKRIAEGHFYTPIPNHEEVRRRAETIFNRQSCQLPGIDLNVVGQLALLEEFGGYYQDHCLLPHPAEGKRYFTENDYFGFGDGIVLHCMLRHFQPKRIVEVGSGFSTFVMLDTREAFPELQFELTCVEPFAERLKSRLKTEDVSQMTILEQFVQDVEQGVFAQLEAGDILFIDSSHVSKVGSDLNHLMFQVVPQLAPGVVVHFHDIYYPFEYPRDLIERHRYWNEAYLLRTFLQFNNQFQILMFNNYLGLHQSAALQQHLARPTENFGGSLWLRRVV